MLVCHIFSLALDILWTTEMEGYGGDFVLYYRGCEHMQGPCSFEWNSLRIRWSLSLIGGCDHSIIWMVD